MYKKLKMKINIALICEAIVTSSLRCTFLMNVYVLIL